MTYRAHPIANLFPEMTAEDFIRLSGDIEANGLREPIWLYDGQILDGRHRYRACQELGIDARFETFEGDDDEAMLLSLSLNLARRHMTTEQRAAMGAKLKKWEAARAAARRRATQNNDSAAEVENFPPQTEGKARDIAGERVGVSGKYVDQAEKIADEAPDVFEKMERGEYGSMSTAKKFASMEQEERDAAHARVDAGESPRKVAKDVTSAPSKPAASTDTWAPEWLEDFARAVMGSIDMINSRSPEVWEGNVLCTVDSDWLRGDRVILKADALTADQSIILTPLSVGSMNWVRLVGPSVAIALSPPEEPTATLFYAGDRFEQFRQEAAKREWTVLAPSVEVSMRERWNADLTREKEELARMLLDARRQLADVRGGEASGPSTPLKQDYKALAKHLHPDRGGSEEAFQALGRLYEAAGGRR